MKGKRVSWCRCDGGTRSQCGWNDDGVPETWTVRKRYPVKRRSMEVVTKVVKEVQRGVYKRVVPGRNSGVHFIFEKEKV